MPAVEQRRGAVVGGTMTRRAGTLVVLSTGALLAACNNAHRPPRTPLARRGPRGRRSGGRVRRGRRRAAVRGRSVLAEAAAEPLGARLDDRRLGRLARSRLDHPPPAIAERRNRSERGQEHAVGHVLHAGSERHRARRGKATWRARGAAPARATTGRRRTTASPSITWTTSGSAATTSKTRTS